MNIAPVRLLGGIMAALVLALLLEWTWPGWSEGPTPASALRLVRGAAKTPLIERAASNWAAIILARPLFSASRRPPHISTGTHDEAAPSDARLAGIMIGGFGRRAIFAPAGGGKALVLAEGEEVNDSTIRRIEPEQVVLASGTILRPSFDKNRMPTVFTTPFQPNAPNFQAPGYVGGNLPQGNFPYPRMPLVPQQEAEPGQPGTAEGQPVPQAPLFRGPMIPNRRE